MARDGMDKTWFFRYIISKRNTRENMGLLLNGNGLLVTNDMKKAEVLKASFMSVFTDKTNMKEPQALRDRARKIWRRKEKSRLQNI